MPQPRDKLWPSEPRTLIKHQVYRHYLQCWMAKICTKFPSSCIVDAFAGPGEYLDGPAGSPIVIAKTFLEHSKMDRFNTLQLIFLEERTDRRDHLSQRIAELPALQKLVPVVWTPGKATDCFTAIDTRAHVAGADLPTLWILDPFNLGGVPFDLVRSCLARPRDEVLITWFADEIYRFCGDPDKGNALDIHFGGDHWRAALNVVGESARKEALLAAYRENFATLPAETFTGVFSISCKNETARYSLVFATHAEKGLECFNPVKWRLDPVKGRAINENRGMDQGDLFAQMPIVDPLQQYLRSLAGTAASFRVLSAEAARLGFLEKHLRVALDVLAAEGAAVREHPLQASTKWPTESVIRFYSVDG